MDNNIFNKAENKIFFIKINDEVYEMKFENIVIPMGRVMFNEHGRIILTDKPIVTIRVNIALLGEKLWHAYKSDSELPTTHIYATIEDCTNGTNPLFKWDGYERLEFTSVIEPIFATTEEMLMENAYWERVKDSNENYILEMCTYHWDGTKPISKRVYAPNTNETEKLVFYNYNEIPHYDLVNEKHIVDSKYKKTCYATYEECANDNVVKIHHF